MRSCRPLVLLLLIAGLCAPSPSRAAASGPPSDVFYDVDEGLGTLAAANFTPNFTALIAQKGLGGLGLDTAVTVYARQTAAEFAGEERTLPGLGCYTRAARTQGKSQQERFALMEAHFEYLCRGTDPEKTRQQAALAAEVLLTLVDLFPTIAGGIEGGGNEPQSVLVDLDGSGPADSGLEFYEKWVHVVSPIWDTDAVT